MLAKNIRPNLHSVHGKNVVKVRNWVLLTEVVYADGSRESFFPLDNVKVMPARDANGHFIPREYVLMGTIQGRDRVISITGRAAARRAVKYFASIWDNVPQIVAI